jgi:hypothetical protein
VKSSEAPKYQFNFKTGDFEDMPNSVRKKLDKKFPDYKEQGAKGARFLGIAPPCTGAP